MRLIFLAIGVQDSTSAAFESDKSRSATTADERAAWRNELLRLIALHELKFRECEGYYSKGAGACTWPCSITNGTS